MNGTDFFVHIYLCGECTK